MAESVDLSAEKELLRRMRSPAATGPVPTLAEERLPGSKEKAERCILGEVASCAVWLEDLRTHGRGVQDRVEALLESRPKATSFAERQALSIDVRRKIRAHGDAIDGPSGARCFRALEWCVEANRLRVPGAEPPCERLRAALLAYRDTLTRDLGPKFEVMRAVNGSPSYLYETALGLFDRNR